jgi:hypothetical protein
MYIWILLALLVSERLENKQNSFGPTFWVIFTECYSELYILVGTRNLQSKFSILKKWKKNNTGIGPVKWNCLVHTNKIIPKKKRKGEKKKDDYENSSKIFLPPKRKKISMLLIFSNSQIFNNSRSEPSDVTRFPISRRSIWRPKLTYLQRWAHKNTKPPSQACVCLSATMTHTWRWNISGQVRLIWGPCFCHRQTVCAGRRRIQRACVSPPPRPAPSAGNFKPSVAHFGTSTDRRTDKAINIYRIWVHFLGTSWNMFQLYNCWWFDFIPLGA